MRAVLTRISCAVGMCNAKLRNHLKKPQKDTHLTGISSNELMSAEFGYIFVQVTLAKGDRNLDCFEIAQTIIIV